MSAGDEILGIDKRKALLGGGLAALLAVGAVVVVGQVASFGEMLEALRRADKAWFAGCVAGELLAYAGYVLAYRTIARACDGPAFDAWTTTRIVAVGFGAYVVATGAGGLAVDFWALTRAGEDAHEASRRVLALNTLEWAILGSLAALSAIAVLAGSGSGAPYGMTLGWLVAVPACVAVAAWISSPSRIDRYARLPRGDEPDDATANVRTAASWAWVKARKGFADAIGALGFLRTVLARPVANAPAPLGFALYWAGDVLALWAALHAFGESVALPALVLAYASGYVVTSAPLPAGAAGVSEATTALTLHVVGVPLAPAILAVFVYRFFTFWLPIGPALAALPALRSLDDELPELREAA